MRALIALLGCALVVAPSSLGRRDAYEALKQSESISWNAPLCEIKSKCGTRFGRINLSQIENESGLVVTFGKGEFVIDDANERWKILEWDYSVLRISHPFKHICVMRFDSLSRNSQIDRVDYGGAGEDCYPETPQTTGPGFIPISDNLLSRARVAKDHDKFCIDVDIRCWEFSDVLQDEIDNNTRVALFIISQVTSDLRFYIDPGSIRLIDFRAISAIFDR